MEMDKKDVFFIRAKLKDDYVFDGIRKTGYDIMIPYRDYNLFFRCLRELWFRLKLPKAVWFNPAVKKIRAKVIIVKDPLIKPEFLCWVKKQHPDARVVLSYDNRVRLSIDPNTIDREKIELWSYDGQDCEKYGLKYTTPGFFDVYSIDPSPDTLYDVVFLGKDKGRMEYLLKLQEQMNGMGLRTDFHICADRRYLQWKDKRYQPMIPYSRYLEMLSHSKATLNIVPEGQTSLTQREMEAAFFNVKCITNNRAVLSQSFYSPDRFFLIGRDNMEDLPAFLSKTTEKVSSDLLKQYAYAQVIDQALETR